MRPLYRAQSSQEHHHAVPTEHQLCSSSTRFASALYLTNPKLPAQAAWKHFGRPGPCNAGVLERAPPPAVEPYSPAGEIFKPAVLPVQQQQFYQVDRGLQMSMLTSLNIINVQMLTEASMPPHIMLHCPVVHHILMKAG